MTQQGTESGYVSWESSLMMDITYAQNAETILAIITFFRVSGTALTL
jgi:hypothetical protein